jgi:hypothetical protein
VSFSGLVLPDAPPDHSTISRTRRLIDLEFRLIEPGRGELMVLLSGEDREELAAAGIPAPRAIQLRKQ